MFLLSIGMSSSSLLIRRERMVWYMLEDFGAFVPPQAQIVLGTEEVLAATCFSLSADDSFCTAVLQPRRDAFLLEVVRSNPTWRKTHTSHTKSVFFTTSSPRYSSHCHEYPLY
jgi:hypothetical protein